MEAGSTMLENLSREVMEETGLTMSSEPKVLGIQDMIWPDRHVVRITHTGTIAGTPALSEEHTEYNWFRLDEILSNLNVKEIDFISIDVEGHELSVLKGLSLHIHQPRIIIIEDNSHGLDREVKNYLEKFGYARFNITGCNDWYARKSDKSLVSPARMAFAEVKSLVKIIEMSIKAPITRLLPKEKIEFLIKLLKKST